MSKHLKARKTFIFLAYLVIYVLFLLSAFIDFKSKYLWEDESFTFHMIHHGFLSIMSLTAKDVHPFFYYFIAKIFTMPFSNLFTQIKILRLVSILPYFILLLIGHISIRKKFSNTTALLFMFSIVTMPVLINNMEQIRMYGWAMMFVTLMFLKLIYIYKGIASNSISSFLEVTLFALLASYTHYYALIAVALVFMMFLLIFAISKTNIKYLLSSIGISIICYLPWISILLKQTKTVSKNYWIAPLNTNYLISLIDNIFIANGNSKIYQLLLHKSIFGLTILVILCVLAYLIKRSSGFNKNILIISLGVLLPFFLLLIGSIISKIIGQNVLILRYVTSAMGVFWLSIAILFGGYLKSKNINSIFKFILVLLLVILGEKSYHYNISSIKASANQFNETLVQFNKIPRNANIIYNYSNPMYSASSYLKHNYVLGHEKNDLLYPEFHRVYGKNIKKINNIHLNFNKPTYFIKSSNLIKNTDPNKSKLTKKFVHKYSNHMKEVNTIILPNDGGSFKLYKLN